MAKQKATSKRAALATKAKPATASTAKKVGVAKAITKKSSAKKTATKSATKRDRSPSDDNAVRSTVTSLLGSVSPVIGTSNTLEEGPSLGRPTAKIDAKLDELFLRDFKAREVFEFLRVKTLRELEQFSPQEIIDRLSAPMVQTVTRIRKSLAIRNRSLKGDKEFAAEFKSATQEQVGRARPIR